MNQITSLTATQSSLEAPRNWTFHCQNAAGLGASVSLWDRDEELLFAAQKELREMRCGSVETVDISDASEVVPPQPRPSKKRARSTSSSQNAGIAGPNHTTGNTD